MFIMRLGRDGRASGPARKCFCNSGVLAGRVSARFGLIVVDKSLHGHHRAGPDGSGNVGRALRRSFASPNFLEGDQQVIQSLWIFFYCNLPLVALHSPPTSKTTSLHVFEYIIASSSQIWTRTSTATRAGTTKR